jgi:hypothetical protein
MKIALSKLSVELPVIKLDVRQKRRDLYIRAMEKRLTTLDITVLGHYRTYELVWLVVQQTGVGSHLLRHVAHVGSKLI